VGGGRRRRRGGGARRRTTRARVELGVDRSRRTSVQGNRG
jgi:hypothetical protein